MSVSKLVMSMFQPEQTFFFVQISIILWVVCLLKFSILQIFNDRFLVKQQDKNVSCSHQKSSGLKCKSSGNMNAGTIILLNFIFFTSFRLRLHLKIIIFAITTL